MDNKEKKRLIDKINHRIRAVEKAFDFDSDLKTTWRDQLRDLVPDTDMLTNSGLLSMSQEAISMMDEMTIKVLEENLPNTVKELKAEAIESLTTAYENSDEPVVIDKMLIKKEVQSKIMVTTEAKTAIQNWYDFSSAFATAPEFINDPEVVALDNELYAKGQKSYAELYEWMQRAQMVMARITR